MAVVPLVWVTSVPARFETPSKWLRGIKVNSTRCRAMRMMAKSQDKKSRPTRLFSNVAQNERGELERQPVSELSCAALIAGTMIGAGILALPTVTAPAGFLPSSTALIGVWAYMVAAALLITEVSVSTACSLGRPSGVSLLSLGRVTLGDAGAIVTTGAYTFLHYAILTAYTAQGGTVLHQLYVILAKLPLNMANASLVSSQVGFALVLGCGLCALSDVAVERTNNTLVAGVVLSFGAVVASLTQAFSADQLLSVVHVDAVPRAVPVLFVSCVFHNVIGTVAARLEGDINKIRRAIVTGSGLPLAMFLVYNAVVLGADGASPTAAFAVDAFSLLAIVTSFIGFTAGLVDLWSDLRISLLGEEPGSVQRSLAFNYAATVVPPAVFCVLKPGIFLEALDVAGTYGVAVLFGLLPAAMAWRSRENQKGFPRALPGGSPVLVGMALVPVMLILQQLFS